MKDCYCCETDQNNDRHYLAHAHRMLLSTNRLFFPLKPAVMFCQNRSFYLPP